MRFAGDAGGPEEIPTGPEHNHEGEEQPDTPSFTGDNPEETAGSRDAPGTPEQDPRYIPMSVSDSPDASPPPIDDADAVTAALQDTDTRARRIEQGAGAVPETPDEIIPVETTSEAPEPLAEAGDLVLPAEPLTVRQMAYNLCNNADVTLDHIIAGYIRPSVSGIPQALPRDTPVDVERLTADDASEDEWDAAHDEFSQLIGEALRQHRSLVNTDIWPDDPEQPIEAGSPMHVAHELGLAYNSPTGQTLLTVNASGSVEVVVYDDAHPENTIHRTYTLGHKHGKPVVVRDTFDYGLNDLPRPGSVPRDLIQQAKRAMVHERGDVRREIGALTGDYSNAAAGRQEIAYLRRLAHSAVPLTMTEESYVDIIGRRLRSPLYPESLQAALAAEQLKRFAIGSLETSRRYERRNYTYSGNRRMTMERGNRLSDGTPTAPYVATRTIRPYTADQVLNMLKDKAAPVRIIGDCVWTSETRLVAIEDHVRVMFHSRVVDSTGHIVFQGATTLENADASEVYAARNLWHDPRLRKPRRV